MVEDKGTVYQRQVLLTLNGSKGGLLLLFGQATNPVDVDELLLSFFA